MSNKQKSDDPKNTKQSFYIVDHIMDMKISGNSILYKIFWKGYTLDDCTWEPLSNLQSVIPLVTQFNQQNLERHRLLQEQLQQKKQNKSKKIQQIKSVLPVVKKQKQSTNFIQIESDEFSDENEEIKVEKTKRVIQKTKNTIGSFDQSDIVEKIVSAKYSINKEQLKFLVEWQPRTSGLAPLPSYVTNKELAQNDALKLIDFYESRITYSTSINDQKQDNE